jgi:CheY-like chemotaxis protein
MPREVMDRAFEPFFTTKEVGRGTGLGLSQVYGFVKQSGGQVRIASTPGEGTRVELYLPRYLAASVAVAPAGAAPDIVRARPGETILVVDDEAAVRSLSAEMLQALGYTVQVADGAAAALRLLDAHPAVNLLFTDVLMPELDGRELAARALQRRPGLPVLFTSGHTRNVEAVKGLLERTRILPKPFTLAQLASQVRMALDEVRA